MKKLFSNQEIYNIVEKLNKIFINTDKEIILPVRVNFLLQKNIHTFEEAVIDIEKVRDKIIKTYGVYSEEDSGYKIPSENISKAQKDLSDLSELEQKIDINLISLEDLENTQLTTKQMQALFFMIEEED